MILVAVVAVVVVLLMLVAFLFGLMVGAELVRQRLSPPPRRAHPSTRSRLNHQDRRT